MLSTMETSDPLQKPYMTEESASVLKKLNMCEEENWERVKPRLFMDMCDTDAYPITPLERKQLTAALTRPRSEDVVAIMHPNHRENDSGYLPRGTTFVLPGSMSVYDAANYLSANAFTVTGTTKLNIEVDETQRGENDVLRSLGRKSKRASRLLSQIYAEASPGREPNPFYTAAPAGYGDEVLDRKVWHAEMGPNGRVSILKGHDASMHPTYTALVQYTPMRQMKLLRREILENPTRFSKIPMSRFLDIAEVKTLRSLARRNAQRLMSTFLSYISTEHDQEIIPGQSGRPDIFGFQTMPDHAAVDENAMPLAKFYSEHWAGIPGVVQPNRFSGTMRAFLENALGRVTNEDLVVMYNDSYSPHEYTSEGNDRVIYRPITRGKGVASFTLSGPSGNSIPYNNIAFGVLPVSMARRNYGVTNYVRGDAISKHGNTEVPRDVQNYNIEVRRSARDARDEATPSYSSFRNRENAYSTFDEKTNAQHEEMYGLGKHTKQVLTPYFTIQSTHNPDENRVARAVQGSSALEF